MSDITVIGLGAMGSALARTLLDAGRNAIEVFLLRVDQAVGDGQPGMV